MKKTLLAILAILLLACQTTRNTNSETESPAPDRSTCKTDVLGISRADIPVDITPVFPAA